MMVQSLHLLLISAVTTVVQSTSSARAALIRGISYGPTPLKSPVGASQLPGDDWYCDEAVPMWGAAGRGDLRIMRQLGANLVRLYGNNPEKDHTNFLDEAHAEGLGVAPGMSDYPYYQQVPGSCLQETDFNCFSQIKPLYMQNLRTGFLKTDKSYHPALRFMNILNEPDLKMPPSATVGDLQGIKEMCRSLISAFDAMLDAEKEAGVTGPMINFTATFSYAICASCEFSSKPALGQMAQLDDAMRHPGKYGYEPKNDITEAYRTRFTHSFNTQNPATDLQHQFLDEYNMLFPETPVYIGEYHRVDANQTEDLDMILALAEANPLFLGISFFEYQVAYWKTGTEMAFGMFGLGNHIIGQMPYFSATYEIDCLVPRPSIKSGVTLPDAVAAVYGGAGVDNSTLCVANPLGVPLSNEGYLAIVAQQSTAQMALFVRRMLNHLGAYVLPGSSSDLMRFAARFAKRAHFRQMASELGGRPAWVTFDSHSKCVANRNVDPSIIGKAIGWVCEHGSVDCSTDLPVQCKDTPYRMGDYLFSRYFDSHSVTGRDVNPLLDCDFMGAAIFAPQQVYNQWTGVSECTSAATTTTTTVTSTTSKTTSIHLDLTESSTLTPNKTTTPSGFMSSAEQRPLWISYCMVILVSLSSEVLAV